MREPRDLVPRAKEAWWWLGGLMTLGLLGAGVVAAGVALWENIDIRQLTPALAEAPPPIPEGLPPVPAAAASVPFRAVLLRSAANEGYFDDPTYYATEIARWRTFVERVGGTVRVATGAEELRPTDSAEVMLLPEAPCLSSEELAIVNAHLRAGGSVAANWALGVRDGACEWRGWSTLLDVTGAEDIRELPTREGLYVTVPGGLPVSPGFDPGTRIELRPDPSLALRVPGERVYWSDWALNPAPDEDGAGADVAVVTRQTASGGRVTWFGLRTLQAATAADSVRLDHLFANGLRWVGGVPTAGVGHWPEGAQAALIVVLDVEGEDTYVNARDAAAAFRTDRIPITFFAVSQLVSEDPELAEALAAAGEVGTQTVDHTPLAGLTAQAQSVRLRRSWNEIEAWTGVGPMGLRPPEEAFDSATVRSWRQAGGRYILAGSEARSGAPEIHDTSDGPVVLIPRLIKDDYDIVVRDVTVRAVALGSAYLAGANKMHAIGGLAVVAGHTQIISNAARLEALRSVADSARAQGDWWITRADELAAWWFARSGVLLHWEESSKGGNHPELIVTGSAETDIGDLWIDVVAPLLPAGAIPFVDDISVEYLDEAWGMRVHLGALNTGVIRRISFTVPAEQDRGS
jgi:peptidoglycan/xylan/chitin deacetylase (PgdA/CDA1 family)